MKILPYVWTCVFLALCLILSNCTEDIPDPLTADDVLDILGEAPTDSETGVTDTSGANPDTTDVIDITIDITEIDTSGTQNSGLPDDYWISDTMEPGAWVEYRIYMFSGTRKDRLEYIDTDTYEGHECYVVEYDEDTTLDGGTEQIWVDKATGEVVLMALDEDGEVFVMEYGLIPDPIISMLSVLAHGQETGTNLYATPTGKTTDATIYDSKGDETWVSDDIPFRLVKSLVDDQVDVALYNYGDSGAERNITKADIEDNIFDGFEVPVQGGEIIINIGDGPRPEIQLSEPIAFLIIVDEDGEPVWGFQANDQQVDFPGPFQYGVVPNDALQTIPFDGSAPPDLVVGQTYEILVMGGLQEEMIPLMGELVFVR